MNQDPATRPRMGPIRRAALLFPPAGLLMIWMAKGMPVGRRLFGTLFILLYSIVYAVVIVVVLWKFFGMQFEFRGSGVPAMTWRKTLPDYAKLEASRLSQSLAHSSTNVAATSGLWPGFRGARRDGHYREEPILTNWPANGPPLLWKQPGGGGYASFAVADGRAFTIEQRREHEVLAAYSVATGRELWTNAWKTEFQEPLGGDGPRATPAWDNGKVYGLGAMGELRCVEAASGRLIWRTNALDENRAPVLTYGMSASPLVDEERLIIAAGGPRKHSVIAYDKETGRQMWGALDDGAAYSSPMVVELAGERQLLVVTRTRAVALSRTDGKLLWQFPWVVLQGNRNIAQPVIVSTNRVFLSAGYGTGCAVIEIQRTKSGFQPREVWRNKNLKNKFTSSVFLEGYLYGLDEDILTCVDAQSGERAWKDGRYGYGQMLLATEHLLVLCGNGDLALVRATPQAHHELSRFPAIEGKTWNHPVLAGGLLLARNNAEMACFDLRIRPAAQ